jgi:heme/copper-type cytochrome/quinol oxidase subunit 3
LAACSWPTRFIAYEYPAAFVSASNHLDIKLGAINTAVLIVSSFTMAMAVYSTQIGRSEQPSSV